MTDAITAWLAERKKDYERVRVMGIAGPSLSQMSNLGKALSAQPRLVAALEAVASKHTRVVGEHYIDGPIDVCEQCSEDSMYAPWPCDHVEAIESALGVRDE